MTADQHPEYEIWQDGELKENLRGPGAMEEAARLVILYGIRGSVTVRGLNDNSVLRLTAEEDNQCL